MTSLIKTIVTSLVDHPEAVSIKSEEDENRITYYLSVHEEDMGKVIGKQGRVAKAIRTVIYAAGSTQQKKIYLEISE
ncbi:MULTISPECIES: KH domain-containing protein [Bacillus]|uniref:KH domain-containing protein n=1 Tax=Bacillus TaxID=1386 RepID=UPI000477B29F|nr:MULTISPECIES: KH domain-containing protein [Bacillus]